MSLILNIGGGGGGGGIPSNANVSSTGKGRETIFGLGAGGGGGGGGGGGPKSSSPSPFPSTVTGEVGAEASLINFPTLLSPDEEKSSSEPAGLAGSSGIVSDTLGVVDPLGFRRCCPPRFVSEPEARGEIEGEVGPVELGPASVFVEKLISSNTIRDPFSGV